MSESIKTRVSGELLFSVFFCYIRHFGEDWMWRCLSTAEKDDARTMTTGHSNVLHPMTPLLREWARSRLMTGLWKDMIVAAGVSIIFRSFACVPDVNLACSLHSQDLQSIKSYASISRWPAMCQTQSRVSTKCVVNWHREWTASKQIGPTVSDHIRSRRRLHDHLLLDFESRSRGKLEDLGDSSMNAGQYDEAILQYTTALSLNPTTLQNLLGKRSKACAGKGEWENALNDANEVAHYNLFEFSHANG